MLRLVTEVTFFYLAQSKNELVIPDHMDSLPPIKQKIRKGLFY